MKKYEFTEKTKQIAGKTLVQIRALIDLTINGETIEAGTMGGWLESEKNLSQDGNARVYTNAWVFGDALRPVGNAFEMHLIDEIHLKPLEDERSMCYFFLRHAGDTPYIAVKSGMMLHAVIMPKKIAPKVCGQMVQTITEAEKTQQRLWKGED